MSVRRIALALMACAGHPAHGQSTRHDEGFVAEVDSARLAASGASRVHETVRLAGAHVGISLDGFRTAMDPGFLSAPGQPAWRLRVDGVPVPLGGPFDLHPELAPVAVGAIRRVEVGHAPSSGPGGLSPGGWIDVETSPPSEGLFVSGYVSAANEVGDPGPYRYTYLATPNADRIGPAYGVRGSVRAGSWWFEGGLRGDEIHMTDPALAERVRLLYRGYRRPRLLLAAPFLALTHRSQRARHRIGFAFNALRDLRFLPETGAEVPSLSRQWGFGAAGEQWIDDAWRLVYAADARQQDLLPRTSDQPAGYNQRLWRVDLEAGASRALTGGEAGLVVGIRRRWLETDHPVPERTVTLLTARIDARWQPSGSWRHRWSVEALRSDEDPARPGRIRVSALWDQGFAVGRATVHARTGWFVTMPEAQETPWFWIGRGWEAPAFPTETGARTVTTHPPFLMDARTGTLDLEWNLPTPRSQLSIAAFGRLFRGLTLPWTRLGADAGGEPRSVGTVEVRTGVGGYVVGGRFGLAIRTSGNISHRLDVTFVRPVPGGDETFWQHWVTRPALESAWSVTAEPIRRTSVHLAARYLSRTLWPALVPDRNSERPIVTLPPRVDLTLALVKRLWGPHATVFAVFDHLLDRPFRTHPLGQSDRFVLQVGATARFGVGTRGS